MTTQTVEEVKPHAEFVGYQKDDRVGGVRGWYIIQAPGTPRHLSTVFAPTLLELKIPIPKHPPYFPDSKFSSVWIFSCKNDACHISWLDKNIVVDHVKETKHYQIIQELITTTEVENAKELGLVNKLPKKAILLDQNDTQELDDFGQPIEQAKKKHKIVLIGDAGERLGFESIKDSIIATKEADTVASVVSSRVVDYSKPKEAIIEELKEVLKPKPETETKVFVPSTDEQIKKGVDEVVLSFRNKIHAAFPDIYGSKKC